MSSAPKLLLHCSLIAFVLVCACRKRGSSEPEPPTVSCTILATQPWQSCGVDVQPGDTVTAKAKGWWSTYAAGGGGSGPAGGWDPYYAVRTSPKGGHADGALLVATGANGMHTFEAAFDVTALTVEITYTPTVAGTIEMQINDAPNSFADNSGEMEVDVWVDPGGQGPTGTDGGM